MNVQISPIRNYIEAVLGRVEEIRPWEKERELPLYLQSFYEFYKTGIHHIPSLLICEKPGSTPTLGAVIKHLQAVKPLFSGQSIYVTNSITSYDRRRLINEGIPFIVPKKQMYLPFLGALLSENFSSSSTPLVKKVSPLAQVLVLAMIQGRLKEPLFAANIATDLGYSKMSVSRAVKELESIELIDAETVGRERLFKFRFSGKLLWDAATPFLRSPVKKIIKTSFSSLNVLPNPSLMRAGESALSQRTMLAEPKEHVYAVWDNDWSSFNNPELYDDEDVVTLELWRYRPNILTDDLYIDDLSLYLSLKNSTTDERVQQSLSEILIREIG